MPVSIVNALVTIVVSDRSFLFGLLPRRAARCVHAYETSHEVICTLLWWWWLLCI